MDPALLDAEWYGSSAFGRCCSSESYPERPSAIGSRIEWFWLVRKLIQLAGEDATGQFQGIWILNRMDPALLEQEQNGPGAFGC